MTITNRTVTIKSVFAENANTTIPNPPVSGTSYRNESTTATEMGNGWAYKNIVDSAKFNEAMYEYSTITKLQEKYGFIPWSDLTDYEAGSVCLGSDGTVYQAKQNTGPSSTAYDPVNDTSHTYWEILYTKNVVTLGEDQTITGYKTFSVGSKFNSVDVFPKSGESSAAIDFHHNNNSSYTARILTNPSGTLTLHCTTATAPASSVANSILTTVSVINNEYGQAFILGNGLIIQQGGVDVSTTGEHIVQFPTPFSGVTYSIVKNYGSAASTVLDDRESSFYSLTSTSAKTYCTSVDTTHFQWIAIGV